jgi:hypothetical protein
MTTESLASSPTLEVRAQSELANRLKARLRQLAVLLSIAALCLVVYQSFRVMTAPVLDVSLLADYEPWSVWLRVNGSAYLGAQPLAQGTARVTIETSSPNLEYSLHVPVTDGNFALMLTREQIPMAPPEWQPMPLRRVTAAVTGHAGEHGAVRVLGPNQVDGEIMVTAALFLSLMFGAFAALFTGKYTRHKQQGAIVYAYAVAAIFFIFPLAIPVAVAVFPGMGYQLAQTPVGFLRVADAYMGGDSSEQHKALKMDQWSINIGGSPRPTPDASAGNTLDNEKAVSAADKQNAARVFERKDDLSTAYDVQGGLVVPLYVIVLATLGGAFRMTRAVPEIEQRIRAVEARAAHSASVSVERVQKTITSTTSELHTEAQSVQSTVKAHTPLNEESAAEAAKHRPSAAYHTDDDALAAERKDLTHQVVYLFTSPFMGILAYYALVLVHQEFGINTPIVAVAAFVSGMKSEDMLQYIVGLASATQRRPPQEPATAVLEQGR